MVGKMKIDQNLTCTFCLAPAKYLYISAYRGFCTSLYNAHGEASIKFTFSTKTKRPTIRHEHTAKRPGTGISPMRWDEVMGQVAQRNYKEDDLI